VQTDNASLVAVSVATLNGTLNPNGVEADAWFEYGTNPDLASYDNTPLQHFAAGSGPQSLSHPLGGLTPGTTYYFRLVASSTMGFREGQILSFTTHNPPPQVTTAPASAVTLEGATLNGSVNPNGAPTDAWFEYGDDPTLSAPTQTDNQALGFGRTAIAVEAPASGLLQGRTYYYRMVASSVEGVVEGEVQTFTTTYPPPAATTSAATDITTGGAMLHGIANPNGFAIETWFEYGTDPTLTSPAPAQTAVQAQPAGTDNIALNVPVNGLFAWTTYYYRAVARSAGDPTVVTRGDIRSFPTGEQYVAVGDSITVGSHDDILTDGIGYEPVLANLLAGAKGYPIAVQNAGVSGTRSADGASSIWGTLSAYPSARYFLILYGTNDATIPAVSKATYKANMQSIIDAIVNDGRTPYLAKVPYNTDAAFDPAAIQDYNSAIDELRASNGITVVAPDFYFWFQSHPEQLADGIHPNGVGYQSMATQWSYVLP